MGGSVEEVSYGLGRACIISSLNLPKSRINRLMCGLLYGHETQ
ncbi:hypothetical protein PSE_p0056 (plasmid) [Pseudovibrio sp. FO-BEG1]|nr:hypothetical protein PSE_p0056 [Pseudovibrio sp. FO-BEG1]